MGAGPSQDRLPSRQEIFKRTKGGRDLINPIFNWMLNNTALRDLYQLGNPRACDRYIFLTADALGSFFKRIEIEPKAGPKGTIFFQKTDVLVPKDPKSTEYQQREVLCLQIAFFFVRIFQIFGSLALSVLDSDPVETLKVQDILRRGLEGVEEIKKVPLFPAAREGRSILGGAVATQSLPPAFKQLGYLLNRTNQEGIFSIGNRNDLFIKIDTSVRNLSLEGEGEIEYYLSQGRNRVSAKILITGVSETTKYKSFKIEFSNWEGGRRPDILPYNNTLSFIKFQTEKEHHLQVSKSDTFSKIILDLMKRAGKEEAGRRAYPAPVVGAPAILGRPAVAAAGQAYLGEVAVRRGLRTKELEETLKQSTPVKAHCVARALQLLSAGGLETRIPPQIYSHVCRTSFMVEEGSLPKVGDGIHHEKGIAALGELFYDTIAKGVPAMSEESLKGYRIFLTSMRLAFENKTSLEEAAAGIPTNPDKLAGFHVINKLPEGVCKTERGDQEIIIKKLSLIRELRKQAGKMLQYQIIHTAEVTKILGKLFLIPLKEGQSLNLHPNVIRGGLAAVNTIGVEARNLLIKYYSNCESYYRQGTEVLKANKESLSYI